MKLNRNDTCHCGSGKKYKKCHLEVDTERERQEKALRTLNQWVAYHGGALATDVRSEAREAEPVKAALEALGADLSDPIVEQIALYDITVGDAPLIAKATTPDARHTDSRDSLRAVLARSVLTGFEVTEVKRDKGVRLRDRLLDVDRWIPDAELALDLEPMEALVGRVITVNDSNVLIDGWERIAFRGRKAAFRELEAARDAADIDSSEAQVKWVKSQAVSILKRARAAAVTATVTATAAVAAAPTEGVTEAGTQAAIEASE
ncbi:MAG: hypothetical protein ACI9U2_004865 [Bradymonadia bacterium]